MKKYRFAFWEMFFELPLVSDIWIFRKLKKRSFLESSGWLKSYSSGVPVSRSGQPIPWYTYCAITFLEARVNPSMAVFEYGSGNSTLWWSSRVGSVVSVEHDGCWFERMKNILPKSVNYKYIHLDVGDVYQNYISEYRGKFDVIVIDGRRRVECVKQSLGALKEGGVIVWDNSDRTQYSEGYQFLIDNGFPRLDFSGAGPINMYEWSTSIFYRNKNCFNI